MIYFEIPETLNDFLTNYVPIFSKFSLAPSHTRLFKSQNLVVYSQEPRVSNFMEHWEQQLLTIK